MRSAKAPASASSGRPFSVSTTCINTNSDMKSRASAQAIRIAFLDRSEKSVAHRITQAENMAKSFSCRRRHRLSQGGGKVNLMFLLLLQDFADMLCHGEFAERLALANAVAIGLDCLGLVPQVE